MILKAQTNLLNQIAALRVVNDSSFQKLKTFEKNKDNNPINFLLDLMNYLGNDLVLGDNLADFFEYILDNINNHLVSSLKDVFLENYLCNENFLFNKSLLIPLVEIDYFNRLNLAQSEYNLYYSNIVDRRLWSVANNFNPLSINGLNLSFSFNSNIGGINYPNVLGVNIQNVNAFDFLSEYLKNYKLITKDGIFKEILDVNYNNLGKEEQILVNYIKNISASPDITLDNSYYTLIDNKVIYNDLRFKEYGEITDEKPNILNDVIFSNSNSFKDNFNLLLTNLNSTANSTIHVLKQLFSNLSNAIFLNLLKPSLLLLYRIFENNPIFGISLKEIINNNIGFFKEIIFNIVQKTLYNIIFEKVKDELIKLINDNIIGDQREKTDFYLLQYRSLIKFI